MNHTHHENKMMLRGASRTLMARVRDEKGLSRYDLATVSGVPLDRIHDAELSGVILTESQRSSLAKCLCNDGLFNADGSAASVATGETK